MAVTGRDFATLADVAKRLDKDGKIDAIAELLSQTNEVLADMPFMEGNMPTGHKSTIRTGLPSVAWRALYRGVTQSKSTTQQVQDDCGMLEGYSDVDKDLADLNGNTAEFRLSEDRAFLQAMNIEMANTLFYGDVSKTPSRFHGLSPRYVTLDKKKAGTAENIIDAGGTASGELSSVWLVGWGKETVFGIYPKGSIAGFTHTDKGQTTLYDDEGKPFEGYRTHYQWKLGLVVRDWRYVVRIANIHTKSISDNALVDAMIEASEMLPDTNLGSPAFYMSRALRTRLRKAQLNKENVRTSFDTVAGKKVQYFDEIPVRRCDALAAMEARVA